MRDKTDPAILRNFEATARQDPSILRVSHCVLTVRSVRANGTRNARKEEFSKFPRRSDYQFKSKRYKRHKEGTERTRMRSVWISRSGIPPCEFYSDPGIDPSRQLRDKTIIFHHKHLLARLLTSRVLEIASIQDARRRATE